MSLRDNKGDLRSSEAAGSGDPRRARRARPPQSAFGGLDGLRLYGIHFSDVLWETAL
jgi:hypothetical protein